MATNLINLSNDLAATTEQAAAAIVAVQARPRLGSSGIVWRKNLIITASEGIRFEEGIKVILPGNRAVEAKLRGRDPSTDLALLEADTGKITPLELAPDQVECLAEEPALGVRLRCAGLILLR